MCAFICYHLSKNHVGLAERLFGQETGTLICFCQVISFQVCKTSYLIFQIDRLTSLLKDPPQKHSLMQSNVRDIPPLSVVHYPSVDFLAREKGLPLPPALPEVWGEQKKGYNPGPLKFRSLTAKDNYIPVYDYEHLKYAALYGHDFE